MKLDESAGGPEALGLQWNWIKDRTASPEAGDKSGQDGEDSDGDSDRRL